MKQIELCSVYGYIYTCTPVQVVTIICDGWFVVRDATGMRKHVVESELVRSRLIELLWENYNVREKGCKQTLLEQ